MWRVMTREAEKDRTQGMEAMSTVTCFIHMFGVYSSGMQSKGPILDVIRIPEKFTFFVVDLNV